VTDSILLDYEYDTIEEYCSTTDNAADANAKLSYQFGRNRFGNQNSRERGVTNLGLRIGASKT
jgi:hypothetical protein